MDDNKIISNFKSLPLFPESMEKLSIRAYDLSDDEKVFLLACAILLIKKYDRNKELKSFAELAYFIILKYSTSFKDYQPLYDLSVNMGFYPIANTIANNNYIVNGNITNSLIPQRIVREYSYKNIIETKDQDLSRKTLLNSTEDELCYIAPTSFGKSSIILEHIKNNLNVSNHIAIIVPTKSLLMQTYRNIRKGNFNVKILIHDEMYEGQDKFIAVLTQERALRLLDKNDIYFDIVYIDEAHLLLEKDSRSILLSRLIKLNKLRNSNSKIFYLSPLISNKDNIKIEKEQNIFEQRIDFNMKEPSYYEYRENGEVYQYNRFLDTFYKIGSCSDMFSYIKEKATSKTFCYLYTPRKIEDFSKELASKLPEIDISDDISDIISNLKNYVHDDFLEISLLKKGIIYLHGKMPESIKDYLEYKFSLIPEIRYIVANKVILEGINLPINSLIILNTYKLGGKELTNLIGRVNRLDRVFSQPTDLNRLMPPIHFINNASYNRNAGKMQNKMRLLRSTIFDDKIKNPILEKFDINTLPNDDEKKKVKQIISYEDSFFAIPTDEIAELKRRMISLGMTTIYNIDNDLCAKILERINKLIGNEKLHEIHFLDRLRNIFIRLIDHLIIDEEFRRLKNDKAIAYYKMYFKNRKRSLKENIAGEIQYFKSCIERGENYLYIGKSYGEEPHFNDEIGKGQNVYVNLSKKSSAELANIAIIKQKIEDDFVSYKIRMFIQLMYDYQVLSKEEYYSILYGTTNPKKIFLVKTGLTINLINRLEKDRQLDNILFDANGNIITNESFEKYKTTIDDYYRFELNKYL